MNPPAAPARRLAAALVRLADVFVVVAIGAGVYLLFAQLAWNGSTWDERVDFNIAADFVRNGSFLSNRADPTQSRLPHLVGAAALALLGENLWAFKLPFAAAGLLAGLLLWRFVAARHGRAAATAVLAFCLTNPWLLGSARSAATAGDVLVVLTTFAFFAVAVRLFERRSEPAPSLRAAALLGVVAGLAVGAKLTSGVLLPAGFVLVAALQRSLRHLAVYAVLAGLIGLATNPLLLVQPESFAGALRRASGSLAIDPALLAPPAGAVAGTAAGAPAAAARPPVSLEPPPKLRYLEALLVGKLTLPFLGFVALGIAVGLAAAWRTRRFDPAFWGALVLVLATCAVPIWKDKQNANYFLPLLLPAATLAAVGLGAARRSAQPLCRAAVALAWVAVPAFQLWLCAGLAPDYLQAGRRLGPQAQGLMAGPAVNHCQGGPLLIARLNELRRREGFDGEALARVRVFETCIAVLLHDVRVGPVAPAGYSFVDHRHVVASREPYLLVVHDVIRHYHWGSPQHAVRNRHLDRLVRSCEVVPGRAGNERWEIYHCPGPA